MKKGVYSYKKRVVNQVIALSAAIICVIGVLSVMIIANSRTIGRYAVLINEAGKIRGGIQRVVKLDLMNQDYGYLVDSIDRSIRRVFDLEHSPNVFERGFRIGYIEQAERDWYELKHLLGTGDVQEIRLASERSWHSAFALVSYIEKKSLEALRLFYIITFILFAVIVCLVLIIIVTKVVIRDRIVYQSDHDNLTGLYNRHFFYRNLEREYEVAKRSDHKFAILMCDIDHFKKVNDTWGHDWGDRVLREIAQVLSTESREIDMVARYGGEEFIVFMLTRSEEECVAFAERIRVKVAEHIVQKKIGVTISIGICLYVRGVSLEQMLKGADTALYEAKDAGRNCVRVYQAASST